MAIGRCLPDGPDHSPPLLPAPPRRGPGVRRLNRVPILFGVGACHAGGGSDRLHLSRAPDASRWRTRNRPPQKKPEPASGAAVLNNAPIDGEVKSAVSGQHAAAATAREPPEHPVQQSTATPSDSGGTGQAQGEDEATKARREAWQTYYQQVAQLRRSG